MKSHALVPPLVIVAHIPKTSIRVALYPEPVDNREDWAHPRVRSKRHTVTLAPLWALSAEALDRVQVSMLLSRCR